MHRNVVTHGTRQVRVEEIAYSDEVIDVYCWRLEQLLAAGYSQAVSDALASDGTIDLHAACALLTRGCPEKTAFQILS